MIIVPSAVLANLRITSFRLPLGGVYYCIIFVFMTSCISLSLSLSLSSYCICIYVLFFSHRFR
jgi:hypothetical protein